MPVSPRDDERLRAELFGWLVQRTTFARVLAARELKQDFRFDGEPLPLQLQNGIRKPAGLDAALAFTTVYTPAGGRPPYEDAVGSDGLPRYKWRGTDPGHHDNRALRTAMLQHKPLVWFVGVGDASYVAHWPVYLVAEEPAQHQFVVALDAEQYGVATSDMPLPARRAYAERITRMRLHQPVFRAQVLRAYQQQCSLCHLRHPELLDAAHIRTDAAGGEPVVPNGVSMCKIHHAAFDAGIFGVDPDGVRVEVRADVLSEIDGPMLRHGLQAMHGQRLILPRRADQHPDGELLGERFAAFRARAA